MTEDVKGTICSYVLVNKRSWRAAAAEDT